MTEPPSSFVEELRRELLAAADREARRRRRRPLLAAAAAGLGAVATALLLLVPQGSPAAADVVVRIHGEVVEVRLVDLEHRPERIEAAVRAAGLDVRIRAVPVGPSSVGRFVGQESSGPLPPELAPVGDGPAGFVGFRLPVGWPGRLTLLVGAPAADGEAWARFSDATAPGEALACRRLAGRTAAEVVGEVTDAPASVRFRVEDRAGGVRLLTAAEVLDPPWSGWRVAGALGVRSDEVVVRLVPPTEALPPAPPRAAGCGP